MRIGIIGKTNKQEVFGITDDLCKWLKERGIETYVESEIGFKIGHLNSIPRERLPEHSDVVLVFGGDGTFLDVARLVCRYNIPILGVNLGGLGFLTEITTDELRPAVEEIINGNYVVEKREML
ncbi:MAG: NAD(+)/NADH kinase, partial [Thermodesulfobacteriota bacterium]